MKDALLNAAIYAGTTFGIQIAKKKLDQRLEKPLPVLIEGIKPYMKPLTEFYEIGEEVAMGDARSLYALFGMFGEWFGSYCYDNNKFPEDEEAIAQISALTFSVFTSQMSSEQDGILQRRLEVEVKEYANE